MKKLLSLLALAFCAASAYGQGNNPNNWTARDAPGGSFRLWCIHPTEVPGNYTCRLDSTFVSMIGTEAKMELLLGFDIVVEGENDVIGATELNDGTDTPSDEECLTYEATGSVFEWQNCGGGGSGITVGEDDGTPNVGGTTTLQFDQADGFVVTDESGGQVQVDLASVPASVLDPSGAYSFTNTASVTGVATFDNDNNSPIILEKGDGTTVDIEWTTGGTTDWQLRHNVNEGLELRVFDAVPAYNVSPITFATTTGNITLGSNVDASGVQMEVYNATTLSAADCNEASEAGRIGVDTDAASGQRFYVCEGASGWVLQGDGGGAGTFVVEEADATVEAAATNIDFGPGFDVTSSPAGEANIVLDLTEKQVNLATEVTGNLGQANIGTDAIGTDEFDDGSDTPAEGQVVMVAAGAAEFEYVDPIGEPGNVSDSLAVWDNNPVQSFSFATEGYVVTADSSGHLQRGAGPPVTTNTTQTITGVKTISGEVNRTPQAYTASTGNLTPAYGSSAGNWHDILMDANLTILNPTTEGPGIYVFKFSQNGTGGFNVSRAATTDFPDSIVVNTAPNAVTYLTCDSNGSTFTRCWNDYAIVAHCVAASDETTALTTGTAKTTFRMPFPMQVTQVRASLTTAGSTSGTTTIDVNEGGTSILSTKLTIDQGEKTSETAAAEEVISDTALAGDAEITIDIDAVTGGANETGLKVCLRGLQL